MHKRGRLITILLCTVLLAGCQHPSRPAVALPTAPTAPAAAPSAPGANPQPQAGARTEPTPTAGCTRQPNQALGAWGTVQDPTGLPSVENGTCHASIDTGTVLISFALPAGVNEATARAALAYGGSATPTVRFQQAADQSDLQVQFPAGQPGEGLSIRLHGPFGAGGQVVDMGYELQRIALGVQMDRQQTDGSWAPITNGATVARAPLTLRLRKEGPLNAADLRSAITTALGEYQRLEEQPDGNWLVHVDQPPARLWFDFTNAQTAEGLRLRQGYFLIYTGEAPTLVSLDPASSLEQRISTVPADIASAELSPDGRYAMLVPSVISEGFDYEIWITDLQTGQTQKTPFARDYFASPVVWRANALIIPTARRMQFWSLRDGKPEVRSASADAWPAPSSDGRYVAGFTLDASRETRDFIAPATIVVYDLTTGQERTFMDSVHGLISHNDGPSFLRMRWSEDGKSLLVQDVTGRDAQTGKLAERVLRLDLATGATTASTATFAQESWESWLKGPGGWQANRDNWGPIRIKTPNGAEVARGEGRVVGFTPEGRLILIRWPNYHDRLPDWGE